MADMWRRRRRDAAAWEGIVAATVHARARGLTAARVSSVYLPARRGTKAVLYLCDYHVFVDAWFWRYQAIPGSVVFIRPSVGWGPHTQSNYVHYIGGAFSGHGVYGFVPVRDVRRADRHHRRQLQAQIASHTARMRNLKAWEG